MDSSFLSFDVISVLNILNKLIVKLVERLNDPSLLVLHIKSVLMLQNGARDVFVLYTCPTSRFILPGGFK